VKQQGRKRELSPETKRWLRSKFTSPPSDDVRISHKVLDIGLDYIDALITEFTKLIN